MIAMRAGKIHDLKMQVPIVLVPGRKGVRPLKYIADFTYYDGDKFIVADVKGYKKNAVYQIKKKLLYLILSIELLEL